MRSWYICGLMAALSAGCGSAGSSSDSGGAGVCASLAASARDLSCSVDSDCVAVVIGGDPCDPCSAPEDFTCPAAPMNQSAQTSYYAALTAALGRAPGTQFSAQRCGTVVSCPVSTPTCINKTCAIELP